MSKSTQLFLFSFPLVFHLGFNAKDLEEDIKRMRREVLKLKVDFRAARDRLDNLAKEYTESKKFSPPNRYNLLKQMIKDATKQSVASS